MNSALAKISEKKDFVVNSSSLKEVRSFSRDVFDKLQLNQDLKDELVLQLQKLHKILLSTAIKMSKTQLTEWK